MYFLVNATPLKPLDFATLNFADALVRSKAGICDGVPSSSKVFWTGCSKRDLQYYTICKLSKSYFVSAGCHNSIRYLNIQYSDAHSFVRSIANAFTAHELKERYRKNFHAKIKTSSSTL